MACEGSITLVLAPCGSCPLPQLLRFAEAEDRTSGAWHGSAADGIKNAADNGQRRCDRGRGQRVAASAARWLVEIRAVDGQKMLGPLDGHCQVEVLPTELAGISGILGA